MRENILRKRDDPDHDLEMTAKQKATSVSELDLSNIAGPYSSANVELFPKKPKINSLDSFAIKTST